MNLFQHPTSQSRRFKSFVRPNFNPVTSDQPAGFIFLLSEYQTLFQSMYTILIKHPAVLISSPALSESKSRSITPNHNPKRTLTKN